MAASPAQERAAQHQRAKKCKRNVSKKRAIVSQQRILGVTVLQAGQQDSRNWAHE
jgi:hypothetical protein